MPYRRLPNTDKARVRAMNTALRNQRETVEIIIPYEFRIKLEEVATKFEDKLKLKNVALETNIQNNREHTQLSTNARMYLSHFLQVVNMSIQRGELPKEIRTFYGIDAEDTKLPPLNSDTEILEWGKKIINGENNRMNKGGNRIYNPSIALVSINFEKFKNSHEKILNYQKKQLTAKEELANFRATADEYILKLWNILEEHFKSGNEDKSREICSEWGISYVYRKSELKKIEQQRYVESISPALNL